MNTGDSEVVIRALDKAWSQVRVDIQASAIIRHQGGTPTFIPDDGQSTYVRDGLDALETTRGNVRRLLLEYLIYELPLEYKRTHPQASAKQVENFVEWTRGQNKGAG